MAAAELEPLERSEVALPASAIMRPVLTRTKNTLNMPANVIFPSLMSLAPYQK